jgi:hypothetical protein
MISPPPPYPPNPWNKVQTLDNKYPSIFKLTTVRTPVPCSTVLYLVLREYVLLTVKLVKFSAANLCLNLPHKLDSSSFDFSRKQLNLMRRKSSVFSIGCVGHTFFHKQHRIRRFKTSTAPSFEESIHPDVSGSTHHKERQKVLDIGKTASFHWALGCIYRSTTCRVEEETNHLELLLAPVTTRIDKTISGQ